MNGYLLKDFAIEELSICLEKVSAGENWLSPKLDETLIIKKHDTEMTKLLSLTTGARKIIV